jgi:hypothetical protein
MNPVELNTNATEKIGAAQDAATSGGAAQAERTPLVMTGPRAEAMLGLWLRALLSFFEISNHPLTEADHADLTKRDFVNEIRIARTVLWDSSRLASHLASSEATDNNLFDDGQSSLNSFSLAEEPVEASASGSQDQSPWRLAEALSNFCLLCEELLAAGAVSFHAWANVGKMLARELEGSEAAKQLIRSQMDRSGASLQAQLVGLTRHALMPRTFRADLLIIFSRLAQMLEWLALVEFYLRRDAPLKQMLPVFTLINQETRELRRFIDNRPLRIEELEASISDVLDGTNYALAMELRKVYSRELTGLSALRHPPSLYSKVETAHGILRDSFQQSVVVLAQLFEPTLDGALLFRAYQTKKEQSLKLRHELWTLLKLIQQAERERDQHPIVRLLERLVVFQEGSLRYLMYKDWEACERFIEEVGAARGAVELAPVLHRFAAFIETLFSQVSMRAVLADTPFDFPTLEK